MNPIKAKRRIARRRFVGRRPAAAVVAGSPAWRLDGERALGVPAPATPSSDLIRAIAL